MPEPEREPGQNGAAVPFVSIEKPRSVVEVSALGEDRFRITAPGHEQLVTDFEEATCWCTR
jgi:hypothetical protein